MTPRITHVDDVVRQAWLNGGGWTRELLRWPVDEDAAWQLRISIADIESDGPFSSFDGVERWFAVVEGAGVALCFRDGNKPHVDKEVTITSASAPLCFYGGLPPDCGLIDGPPRDLNLMFRNGSGKM